MHEAKEKSAIHAPRPRQAYLDQVRPALQDLRGVILPNRAVERAVRDTLDNLVSAYPHTEIIYKDGRQLAVEISREIGKRPAIFLDRHSFASILSSHDAGHVDVSRGRFFPIQQIPGMGPLIGKRRSLSNQVKGMKEKFEGKEVILVDDLIATSWTITRLVPFFTASGIKIRAIGVAITSKDDSTVSFGDSNVPIFATYTLTDPHSTASFELKNFLVTPGSGAAHFLGSAKDAALIARIRDSVRSRVNADSPEQLRREFFAMEIDADAEEVSRKVAQVVGPELTTMDMIEILSAINLPHFNPTLASDTRSLYIGDYHSPAWQMTDTLWREFSHRQLEVSVRLYEELKRTNGHSITTGQLGLFSELNIDPKESVERFLRHRLQKLEKHT